MNGGCMGLPVYLKRKYLNGDYDEFLMTYWGTESIRKLMEFFYPGNEIEYDNSLLPIFTLICQIPTVSKQRLYPLHVLKQSIIKYGFRKMYKMAPYLLRHIPDSDNDYRKVKIQWFTGWVKEQGIWKWLYKTLKINSCFYESAQAISCARRDNEKKMIDVREELDRIINMEQGRFYTGRLRFMIMKRDGFTCVYCGRGVDEVALEVDHKIAWVDGGKTTYYNGQTVCPGCNKGKHHAKVYDDKLDDFNNIKDDV
jgi:5-methylcytosine-specific restriction endonuclease McrA